MKKLRVKVRATIRQEVKEAIRETNLSKNIAKTEERISQLEETLAGQQNSLAKSIAKTVDQMSQLEETLVCQQNDLTQNIEQQFVSAEVAFQEKMDALSNELDALMQQTKEVKATLVASRKVPVTPQERMTALRKALERGSEEEALQIVKALNQDRKRIDKQYIDCANQMRDMIVEKSAYKAYGDVLRALFNMHTVDEFRREDFLDVARMRMPVMQAASLRQQFVRRRRMKQIGNVPDRWLVYSKYAGEEFAQMVGMKIPASEHGFTLNTLPRKTDIVIKPLSSASSIGVYIVQSEDEIFSVEHVARLHSWDEMVRALQADLNSGRIREDRFEVQEAIYADSKEKTPVHDLKFYSFYGEIPAILEIVRLPEKAYWWWTPDGKLIDVGKTMPEHMKPVGFTPDMLETARELSLKIPAPYMRLDFLRGDDEIYFDEFCTMSGGEYAVVLEQHFPAWDRTFGNCYLKAEMRIVNDLLAGKRFDEINAFNEVCEQRYRKKK